MRQNASGVRTRPICRNAARQGESVFSTNPGPTRENGGPVAPVYRVPDLDAAIGWAARCPAALRGKVEIRPIMEFEQP